MSIRKMVRRRTTPSDRRETREDRAVSSTIGVVLVLAITVALAASLAGLVFGLSETEKTAPHASLSFTVDTDDDEIRVSHDAGDTLYADRTRIVWEFDDATYRSMATDTHESLQSGKYAVFNFDGTPATDGAWTSYGSPGTEDIEPSDLITVSVYDTESNKRVFTDTFTAKEVRGDV